MCVMWNHCCASMCVVWNHCCMLLWPYRPGGNDVVSPVVFVEDLHDGKERLPNVREEQEEDGDG